MKVRSYAKVNLHLQVVGRRPDGYHELRTIFQTVGLADDVVVEVVERGTVRLTVEGNAPSGPENLAWRAAERFRERWAPELGVEIELTKRIPTGGGLGGGSSNAAAVLRALHELTGLGRAWDLWEIARDLGADVPFFLVGGTALGVGRGDEIVALPDLPARDVWLVLPPLSVSTPEVFADVRELTGAPLEPRIASLLQCGSVSWELAALGGNDLELAAVDRYPVLGNVRDALLAAGAAVARLSGSGSSVFALFDVEPDLEELRSSLPAGSRIERVSTVYRAQASKITG